MKKNFKVIKWKKSQSNCLITEMSRVPRSLASKYNGVFKSHALSNEEDSNILGWERSLQAGTRKKLQTQGSQSWQKKKNSEMEQDPMVLAHPKPPFLCLSCVCGKL